MKTNEDIQKELEQKALSKAVKLATGHSVGAIQKMTVIQQNSLMSELEDINSHTETVLVTAIINKNYGAANRLLGVMQAHDRLGYMTDKLIATRKEIWNELKAAA